MASVALLTSELGVDVAVVGLFFFFFFLNVCTLLFCLFYRVVSMINRYLLVPEATTCAAGNFPLTSGPR